MQLLGLYKTRQSPGIVAKVRASSTYEAFELLEGMIKRYAREACMSIETRDERCGLDKRGYSARGDFGYLGTINVKMLGCKTTGIKPSESDDFASAWSQTKTYSISAFFNLKGGESNRDEFYQSWIQP
jgi:hypothetical protein